MTKNMIVLHWFIKSLLMLIFFYYTGLKLRVNIIFLAAFITPSEQTLLINTND